MEPLGLPSGPQQGPLRRLAPLTSQVFQTFTFVPWDSPGWRRGGGALSRTTPQMLGRRQKSTVFQLGCARAPRLARAPQIGTPGSPGGMLSGTACLPHSLQPHQPVSRQTTARLAMTLEVSGLGSVTPPSLALLGSRVGPSSMPPSAAMPSPTMSDKVGCPMVICPSQHDGALHLRAWLLGHMRLSRTLSWTARTLPQPSTGSWMHGSRFRVLQNAFHGRHSFCSGMIQKPGPRNSPRLTPRRTGYGRAYVSTSSVLYGGCGAPGPRSRYITHPLPDG